MLTSPGNMTKVTPKLIEKADGRNLRIVWSDDREFNYDVVELRRACPCAHCVDELTGAQILKPEDVADTVRPVKVRSMGRYALAINWTDGHSSSIYSWRKLRALAGLAG